ncbi:histone-lysine N-methyltransferase SETDB1-B-like [Pempheris klunzingeri]|uniref:histone-lysine N-methyltransferase SETDB1-B-like n=1 Tax=Pempheris klunzingeri TaxID=3127111 RepID=UPI0039805BAD
MEVDEMDKLDTRTLELQQSVGRLKNKMTEFIKREDEDCENMSNIPCEAISSTNETRSKETQLKSASDPLRIKKAVVVLTRLPDYKISALRPPTPRQFYSEEESLSCYDTDMDWEPGDDSSDSDYRLSGNKQKTTKSSKSNTKTRPAAQSSSRVKRNVLKPPVIISPPITKMRPNLPQEELKVDMMVLARKRFMKWQRGKIVDVITREDGRLKYKVSFEEKGKSLVSGHHIAYDNTPKLEQLYVGARVVVRSQDNKFWFQSAILAELPSRKNRLRFLVFLDDHTPLYVGLPFLRLVCRPLEDALDDIPDSSHKLFMKHYLRSWPYFPLYQYWVGESLKAELNEVQQKCKVQVIDCSLMQVIFQDNQQEWLHRGSIRLDHMTSFFEMHQENKDDSD